jgi:GntR family transcriptional regulator, transcriptional repressor for pyruvate dehydrogenase complex
MTIPPVTRAVFSPVTTPGRAEAAAERITAAIALGLVSDGDRLPPEADLAGQLGVATVTLREALATLRDRGLLETRRGRHGGTFVRTSRAQATRLLIGRLAVQRVQDIVDYGDEHLAVAGTAAYLAAQRATPADLDELEAMITALAQATTHWHQCRADSQFHVGVAAAAGSDRLVAHELRLQAETVEYLWLTDSSDPDLASAVRTHEEILGALRDGDPTRAREVAQKHIRKNVAHIVALHDALEPSARRG